jgi:hypothetical protein
MKNYFLALILISFVLGSLSYNEQTRHTLISLYERTRRVYLLQLEDISLQDHFWKLNYRLVEFVFQWYQNDCNELFRIVKQTRDRQLAQCIIGILNSVIANKSVSPEGIKEYYESPITSIKFFLSVRDLIRTISLKENDWSDLKETLMILLSIQEQFLYQLKGQEHNLNLAEGMTNEIAYMIRSYEPEDLPAFLRLFRNLQLLGIWHKGKISKGQQSKAFFLRIYCSRFYMNWKMLEITQIPPKLLCLMLAVPLLSEIGIFRFLWDIYLGPYILWNDDYPKIIEAYETLIGRKIFLEENFEYTPEFLKFLQECVCSESNIYHLDEKDIWLAKVYLYIFPIYALTEIVRINV